MSVRFILGRSGSGKTRFCIDSIQQELQKDCDTPLILLVPEQGTYQAERAILDSPQIRGYSRLNVLSFERLQFLLLSHKTARPVISQLARKMLIYKILRDSFGDLKILGESSRHIGLSSRIAAVISEFYRYGKTIEQLDELIENLKEKGGDYPDRAAMKFSDIRLIFKRYNAAIRDKFLDPDVQLSMSLSEVPNAEFINNGKLWVDGFSSFTGVEMKMLSELIKHTDQTGIALCMDYNQIDLKKPDSDQLSVFYPVQKTYTELLDMTKQIRAEIDQPVLLGKSGRFDKSRELAYLENAFASENSQKCESTGDIDIIRAEDPRSEVRYVARQICEYVQSRNVRYRDIAVIASDLGEYEHYIKAVFEDYGIPYFIDTRQPMSMHPGVSTVNSALKAVSEGYEPSDIFAYLKSGLISAEPGWIDLLENYCLCFGVNSQAWKSRKEWRFEDPSESIFDEDKINRIKDSLLKPLQTLEEQLKIQRDEKISAEDFVRAVYGFLEESGLKERLSEWIKDARDTGNIEQTERHRQFYGKLIELLDETTEVFGETLLPAGQWREILESGFEEVRLGFVPAALDEVLVGSVERSRHPDLKAVFILGASQKDFPVPVNTEGLLEDDERVLAEDEGFGLGQTVTETLACRQYLAYIAFTRASEYLCICYPGTDNQGKPQLRSRFVDTVESLFTGLGEKEWVSDSITPENSKRRFELQEVLCSRLGADSARRVDIAEYRSILGMLESDAEFEKTANIVNSSLNYKNRAVLSRQTAERIFPDRLDSSSTRLGCYAQCPFKYFAEYVLGLEKRREFELKPLDVGSFYHNILDSLFRRLKSESKTFADLQEDELVKILHEQIEKVMGADNFISQFRNRKDHNVYVITSAIRELEECVSDIRELELAGDFKPEYSEVEFGYGRNFLGDLQFEISGNRRLNLRGKIDRIDICRESGKQAAVIIDYKTGSVKFDYASLYHGLDLQLPLYMLAVRKNPDLPDIAGGFLMPIKSSPATPGFRRIEKKDRFQRTPRGIVNGEWTYHLDNNPGSKSDYYTINFYSRNGEPYSRYHQGDCLKPDDFEKLLDFAKNKVIEITEKTLSGDISVTPYKFDDNSTACRWCDYRSVCRYDWQINEPNYLEKVGKKEFLERLENDECR